MKKIIPILILILTVSACGGGSSSASANPNSVDHDASLIAQMIRNASAAVTSTVNVNNSNP